MLTNECWSRLLLADTFVTHPASDSLAACAATGRSTHMYACSPTKHCDRQLGFCSYCKRAIAHLQIIMLSAMRTISCHWDTTKASIDPFMNRRGIDWWHHFRSITAYGGPRRVLVINALQRICCVNRILTKTANINVKNLLSFNHVLPTMNDTNKVQI
jgi:hypothetical protein